MINLDQLFSEELMHKSLSGAAPGNQVHDNKGGTNHKGPKDGQNTATPTRSNAVPKTHPIPENYHKGMNPDDASLPSEEDDPDMEKKYEKGGKQGGMQKGKGSDCDDESMEKALPRGVYSNSPYVVYENTGFDATLAQAIKKGQVSGPGAHISMPLDRGKGQR